MIIGIGTDLLEIERLKKGSHKNLVKRILTDKEIEIYDGYKNEKRKIQFLAGRFAAKEAYSKALGTGIGLITFKDIEVLNDACGKPYIQIENDTRIHLSITHTDNYAQAFVVLENK
ncbi:holo-ACP synthase [Mycoplasmatota bacterium]|nr:holo-ACP synthase [Mycoplasmatota bacterium]